MINKIFHKLKESFIVILPIVLIVAILSLFLDFTYTILITFFISSIFLVIGMEIFTLGANLSMIIIGEKIGSSLMKSKKLWLILIVSFIIGIVITVAEPDLQVLASLIPFIPKILIIIAVGIGVGAFLALFSFKTAYQINLSKLLFILYSLLFLFVIFVPENFIAIAFDSGGVTTGPISVPFIIALGLGFTNVRSDKRKEEDSFGLVALCSIGPIVAILILSLFYNHTGEYIMPINTDFNNIPNIFIHYIDTFLLYLKETFLSIGPIILVFVIYQIITKNNTKYELIKIITGFILTFFGLTLFLTSVNIGFLPVGYILGNQIAISNYKYLLIPLGMLIGYITVKSEPAVHILNEQVENVTGGSISKKVIQRTLSIGVSIALGLSMFRTLTNIPILYILIPGYIISLILTLITPHTFTSIAFDSGGVASGPMTTTFLLPISIGACIGLEGNVLTNAFGLVALVAMTPLITVQLIGVIYKIKSKYQISSLLDESIINYEWSDI